MEKVQWFDCPACDRVVTGLVRGRGPRNMQLISRTHCCLKCEKGRGHDSLWCAGIPSCMFREAVVPSCSSTGQRPRKAHCIVHEPDWDRVEGTPVPALLFLHGAMTYIWPETLHQEVQSLVRENPRARDFVIVAPFATKGEPLAVRCGYRQHLDRFENNIPYVDRFEADLTWECFLSICRALGPGRVDYSRLCVTGFSMGAQATWDLAISCGSLLAAAAPMAGCCLWPQDAWSKEDAIFAELQQLPLRAYSIHSDERTYSMRDFAWMARRRGLDMEAEVKKLKLPAAALGRRKLEAELHSWGDLLQLGLIRDDLEGHNCWDLVYRGETFFGLFAWMASSRNECGAVVLGGSDGALAAVAPAAEKAAVAEAVDVW